MGPGAVVTDVETMVLTKQEAAEQLQLSPRTVTDLISAGRLPVVRFGTAVRIPRSALSIWLDEQALASLSEEARPPAIPVMSGPSAVELIQRGRSEPTVIGGSRRKVREKKAARRAGTSSSLGER